MDVGGYRHNYEDCYEKTNYVYIHMCACVIINIRCWWILMRVHAYVCVQMCACVCASLIREINILFKITLSL